MRYVKPVAAVAFWLAMATLIVWPAMHARLALPTSASEVMLGGIALLVLLHGIAASPGGRWRAMVLPLLLAVLVIRLGFWGLVQFSGRGFSAEAMSHLTWESATVAWQAFRAWTVMALGAAAALAVLATVFLSGWVRHRLLPAWTVLPAMVLLLICHAGTPEWQLLQGIHEAKRRPTLVVDAVVEQRWQASGLVDLHVPDIAAVQATAADQPVNLILVYLESVGSALLDHPRWPGLMPNLQALARSHSLVDEFHASGFVTIEGIVNSQCGTLLPLPRGSGFAEGEGLADRLPCLGDVLAKAGYRQVFLGGADTSFAGKGRFLEQHGYDTVKGMEHWRGEMGMEQRPGTWGLSDADLFEQSLHELEALHEAGRPFNLTLLTIGTHVPGYLYEECTPWHGADPFLNAAHCTDQLVQRWVDALQARDLLRNTVLVITADHHMFANPAMRALFGDAVTDRRLPLVVMGATGKAAAAQPRGASYDLAPTVLDLLDVTHDARFVLGRSLLRESDRPDYFTRRYHDVLAGAEVASPDACAASSHAAPSLPLDRCARRELVDLLSGIADNYGHRPAAFDCRQPLLVELPEAEEASSRFMVGGAEQGGNFVWRGRNPPAHAKGFFALFADADGNILARHHVPAAQLADPERLPDWWHDPWQDGVARVLVAWRAPSDLDDASVAVPLFAPGWRMQQSSIWLWRLDGAPTLVAQGSEDQTLWRIEPSSCRRLLVD